LAVRPALDGRNAEALVPAVQGGVRRLAIRSVDCNRYAELSADSGSGSGAEIGFTSVRAKQWQPTGNSAASAPKNKVPFVTIK
jgi:hypothetical protein